MSNLSLKPERPSKALDKVSWRLIPYMLVLYVVAYLDRINVSFAALQMNKALAFSDEIFGLGAGIFFVGYFLFGLPSNLIVERLGARRWISLIMIAWGLVSCAMSLVKSPETFYLLRFLLGVTEAGFFPGMILYLTYWFPRRRQGFAVARFMTAIPIAGVLGGLIASKILTIDAYGLAGWQWLFLLTGSPAVLLGFSVLRFLPDKPEAASWLNTEEKAWLLAGIQADALPGKNGDKMSVLKILADPRVWHLAFVYFCLTLGMYGFQLWLPQIIQSYGQLNLSQVALLSAVPAIFQAIGMMTIGAHSDRTGERRLYVSGCAAIAAVALIFSGTVEDHNLALVGLSIAAFGIWGGVGPFWSLPVSYLPPAAAAGGIASINSFGNLGGFAGPYIIGLIKNKTHDFVWSLVALSFALLVAAALSLVVRDQQGDKASRL